MMFPFIPIYTFLKFLLFYTTHISLFQMNQMMEELEFIFESIETFPLLYTRSNLILIS